MQWTLGGPHRLLGCRIEQACFQSHNDAQGMQGGHGPTNDPDVQGLAAQPLGQGRYTMPTVDFTMGGSWLLEVHVQQGAEVHKVYLAAYVGEE